MKKFLLLAAAAIVFTAVASAQCRDAWVSQAVSQALGRNANGYGDTGECWAGNYGGGQWSSYSDLQQKVYAHFQVCRDSWIRSAVQQVTGRAPSGYGDYNECWAGNYGGGQWSSYQDLVNKVYAHFHPPAPAQVAARPGYGAPPPATLAQPGYGRAGGSIIAAGAGNIIAAGAGNIIAAGAGNIIAAGAGNFRGGDDMKLAQQGDPQAMYHTGQKLAAEGKDQNLPEAYKWLSLAVENGVAEAADERKAVREKLTPDQVKQINTAVHEWKPVPAPAPAADAKDDKK
ncbi:MAG: hypothetical protein ABSH47_22440 [Bryobacteraceae bacterium]|jgi:hypothetical protein